MTSSPKWFAVYTRPRWEKKVHALLSQKGVESYCPLNRVLRKWSDRVKLVEEPLFKSYVFVRVDEEGRTPVRMTDGVVNFVNWEGKPAIIKDREIQAIKKFLGEHQNVELIKATLTTGSHVLVTSGSFMEQKGKVLEVNRKSIKVLIESLDCFLVAYINPDRVVLSTAS